MVFEGSKDHFKLKENSNQVQFPILKRIIIQIGKFERIDFYDVKRYLNSKEDALENKGIYLEQGILT